VARRWIMFNGVGLLGLVVQLATLALLVHGLGWHYLIATAVAVEAAVLHNFVWHQRVTWRARPAAGTATVLGRLARFHLLNGSVSLAGNLIFMALLTGGLGMHPVAANLVAVLACSIVNFFASEVLVFRTAMVAILLLGSPSWLPWLPWLPTLQAEETADLRPPTLAAWQKYEQAVDANYAKAGASDPFFVHDAFKQPAGWRDQARSGIVMFQPDRPTPAASTIEVPDGRIHHWVGAVFIRGATLDAVLARLRANAGRESESYTDVVGSKLLNRNGDRLQVFMKLKREAPLITVMYNTEHEVQYRTIAATRASSRSTATKIAELAKAGTAQEREKPPGSDSGFLWRLNAYWRYEQVPDGVLIECESVSLSRDIPFVVRPFLTGAVTKIARESLESTLRTLRGVLSAPEKSAKP
jgi:putative flippase GtrA